MRFATIHLKLLPEAELLVRFALKRLSEIEPDQTEPPQVVMALAVAAVFQEKGFHDRLKEQIAPPDRADEILGMSHELFIPALWGQPPDDQDRAQEKLFHSEQNCRSVLHYALAEGKRMLYEKDFEFLRVFEFLTRTGLFCYSFRLCQFEAIRETFRDDPESLVRKL